MAFDWLFNRSSGNSELPDIYPVPIAQRDFIAIDVQNIFSRILTDVLERTDGIPTEKQSLLWDNCNAGESQDGLVSMLSKAMVAKSDLFLVFDSAVKVIRAATNDEKQQIITDYKTKAESKVGIYITFKNYSRTDMIKLYSALEYCSVGGLYKAMNLSKAVQFKFNDMRASTGLADSADVKAQAKAMADGLKNGKDIMMDAKDIVETAKPDLTATNSAMDFIASKQSFYLGLPASWITGMTNAGLGDSGKADSKAVERGLKPYYFSIIKPVIDVLFKVTTSFKSEDFEMLTTANETLKTFELTDEKYISADNKLKIVSKLYGLPEDSEGDPTPEAPPVPSPVPTPPKPPGQ